MGALHSPTGSVLPGTPTRSEHEATHRLHTTFGSVRRKPEGSSPAAGSPTWPRGRMGTLQGSQQLGTLARAGTWYHCVMWRTSGSTLFRPAHASQNPFFWLTPILNQMYAGAVARQTTPTNSFFVPYQENKRIKGNIRAVGPGAGLQHR